jgi:subtilisin family serine protease
MTTYNVALNEGVDYNAFWTEIETDGSGSTYVPQRGVDIVYERPNSLRQCWYDLTDEEAVKLQNDPRVFFVEIPPEFRDDIHIMPSSSQTGLYYKSPGRNPANNLGINWGLFRLNSTTNNTPSSSGTLTYNYPLDGTGVDFVIQDSGLQCDHPDFFDANGVTRVQQINWWTDSGQSGPPPWTPNAGDQNMPAGFYSDTNGHGTHCAGIAAGKTYGRAKNSRIYVMKVAGLGGTGGVDPTYAFDMIAGWHNNKPIDPATGYKRPTVVNMSWGYIAYIQNVSSITYQGNTTNSPTQGQYNAAGLIGAYRPDISPYNIYGSRVSSVDLDVADLLAAGVVLVGAAGNYYQTLATYSVTSTDNYNNYWTNNVGTVRYYMRGGSPACTAGVICVGNVSTATDTPEEKNGSSESGPRVDVWAPGTNIVSTASTTNAYGGSTPYPFNNNYLIMSLDGTSMAAPQVAGQAAQLLQVYPTATPAQIRQKIIDTSIPNMLYTTGLSTDYTNTRSLHGGPNQFAYQPFNTATNSSVTGAVAFNNTSLGT